MNNVILTTLCVKCFMCGESVELTSNEQCGKGQPKMCKKCKDAWIRFRNLNLIVDE